MGNIERVMGMQIEEIRERINIMRLVVGKNDRSLQLKMRTDLQMERPRGQRDM